MKRLRIRLALWLAVSLAAWAPTAWAQPALQAVGVFSLLGDSVQVAAPPDAPTDTRIERTARESLEFKGIGFDHISLRVARDEIQRAQPASRVLVFASPMPMTPAEQRTIAQGAAKAELPDWMVKTIVERHLSHLLLITRSRGSMDARTADGFAIGRGTVEGIGFYMDTLYKMKNYDTGALSTGLLAPYTKIKLTLMDTQSAEVVASYDIGDAHSYASPDVQVVADPWTFMPAADKVRVLRGMVEKGMQRGMQALLVKR